MACLHFFVGADSPSFDSFGNLTAHCSLPTFPRKASSLPTNMRVTS
jgi:hypothetical protein